jgi:hypothetical protein
LQPYLAENPQSYVLGGIEETPACAARLAAIPAGESPANRDAMGRAAMKSRPSADY